MAVTRTLVQNQVVSGPVTSPAVNLASDGSQYWTATLDINAPVGTECDFTIQGSATKNGTYTDVSNNGFAVDKPLNKFGGDATHVQMSFMLYGAGPWWRMNVSRVVGSFTVNSLIVTNAN